MNIICPLMFQIQFLTTTNFSYVVATAYTSLISAYANID